MASRANVEDAVLPPQPEHDLGGLHRRFRPALMAFFLRRLRNHALAEDMTQDVFIRLARSGTQMDMAEAYIFQTAANLLRDRARQEKVRADYRLGLGAIDQLRVDNLDPARVVMGRESLALLAASLRELPEKTRAIFLLYRLENMRRLEIAELYGISVSAVEKHIGKAMAHLMRRLGAPS